MVYSRDKHCQPVFLGSNGLRAAFLPHKPRPVVFLVPRRCRGRPPNPNQALARRLHQLLSLRRLRKPSPRANPLHQRTLPLKNADRMLPSSHRRASSSQIRGPPQRSSSLSQRQQPRLPAHPRFRLSSASHPLRTKCSLGLNRLASRVPTAKRAIRPRRPKCRARLPRKRMVRRARKSHGHRFSLKASLRQRATAFHPFRPSGPGGCRR